MKKIYSVVLIMLLLSSALLSSCGKKDSDDNNSSEKLVIGTVSESEYPDYNESVYVPEVSVHLSEETSSETQSNISQSTSNKSTSSQKTSSKTVKITSEKTSSASNSKNIASVSASAPASMPTSSSANGKKINFDKVKAVWISYIDLSSILTNKSEKTFRNNFETLCKNCVDFGINTLICHVRPFGDSIYPSEIFPWSQVAAGVGKNPGYDPLAIMVELSHKYNLSFHAWLNPFRTFKPAQVSSVPENSTFKKWYNDAQKKGNYIVSCGNYWYYNPGIPQARELIVDGVKEIINKYNVDGVHFDDYFYPTTDKSFDALAYSTYGNGKSLADWRRSNVSTLVKTIYSEIKAKNKDIVFGISPQANIDNDMNVQYADVKLWATQSGYVDYLCPQAYFNYKSESLSFTTALNNWKNLVTSPSVKLMIGIAPYRIGYYDQWACKNKSHTEATVDCGAYAWRTTDPASSNILARQYTDSMAVSKCSGVFLYSYQYVFNIDSCFNDKSTYSSNAVTQAKYEISNLKDAMKK